MRIILSFFLAAAATVSAFAQKVWTLQDCLDYALENNIQLQQTRNTYLSGLEDTQQARAALLPSLKASTSQGVSANPFSTGGPAAAYNGSYGVNSDMTLYSGGKLRNAIKQQEVQNGKDSLSIVQAYIQALSTALHPDRWA